MTPTISLLLNIIVTTIGSLIFLREGHGRRALIVPFVVTSVPAAGAVFTWINSAAGFSARARRLPMGWSELAPVAGAAATGARIGASMGGMWFSRGTMRRVLGVILVMAIALLLDDLVGG